MDTLVKLPPFRTPKKQRNLYPPATETVALWLPKGIVNFGSQSGRESRESMLGSEGVFMYK